MKEYIIMGLLLITIILLIIVIIILFKKKNNNEDKEMIERLGRFETDITKSLGDFRISINKDLSSDFDKLTFNIERKLTNINDMVNERLDKNFEKSNKTFTNVLERLSKIDEAQKKIDSLSSDIVSLEGILTDKKSRGIFGEVTLYHILSSIFGEKNDKVYRTQVTLSNGSIADSIVYAPAPLGTIAIDSKFPLENYRRLVEKGITEIERDRRSKDFEIDVKKHIDAIASKYILPGETTDQAILFLPAEAIFAELNAYHPNIIKYANSKKVWITSPTTLMSLLTIIQTVLRGMEKDKYASIIHEELNKLGIEFSRYKDRWDKLSRSIQTVSNDVENIHTTTEKITKRFDSINNVEIKEIQNEERKELNDIY